MRGLKPFVMVHPMKWQKSHLLQMRGLKHFCLNRKHHRHEVASFTDAWIETDKAPPSEKDLPVASFTDAWIETISEGVTERPETSHLLQMRGLKPEGKILQKEDRVSHLLQMRGLKP